MLLEYQIDPIAQGPGKILVQHFAEAAVDINHVHSMAGAAKYSAEDQAADLSAPMTRVIKDILRVGSFDVTQPDGSVLQWNVTTDSLYLLSSTYEQFRLAGGSSNLYWGAPTSQDQHDVSAEKAIAQIDKMFVADGRLWIVIYVTPDVATQLQNPKNRVSAAIDSNWSSGQVTYPLIVVHVAIVDQPVVGGLIPFAKLSNQSRGVSMTPEQISKLVTEGVAAGLQSFEAKLEDRLKAVATQPLDVAKLEEGIVLKLSNKQAADAAKSAFTGQVDALFSESHIDAATKDALLASGEKTGYPVELLTPFKSLRLSNQGRKPAQLTGSQAGADSVADRQKKGVEAAKTWYSRTK
jgi:hypothetical protein